MFPVDIDLIDPEFYSFYLGLIIEKKNNDNKGVRKKMIFSTYHVEEPHKRGEKLRQTSYWVQALWSLLQSLSNVTEAVLNEDFIPKFATWIAAERQKYDTGNDVIG